MARLQSYRLLGLPAGLRGTLSRQLTLKLYTRCTAFSPPCSLISPHLHSHLPSSCRAQLLQHIFPQEQPPWSQYAAKCT